MKLFDDAADENALEGQWFTFKRDDADDTKSLRLLIRRIPASVMDRIRYACGVKRKTTLAMKGDFVNIASDRDQNQKLNVLRAAWALLDSQNAEVGVRDEGAAKFWASALGAIVNVGDTVKLDGKWGENNQKMVGDVSAVRSRVLNEQDALRNFIVKSADSMNLEADEEDAGKEQTS